MQLRHIILLIILICLAILLGYGCERRMTSEIILPEGKTARIVFIVGEVFLRPVNEVDWVPAQVGDIITEGTLLRTAENSYCELVISSGTIFRMKDRSELQLSVLPQDEKDNRTFVKLVSGELFTKVIKIAYSSSETIETDTAMLGVDGTGLLTNTKAGKTDVLVADGKVNVRMNVQEPPAEGLPPELNRILKKLERGTNIREGYIAAVTAEDIQEVEDIIAGIVQRGKAEEIEIENLRQQIQLRAEPLDKKSRDRLKELDVMLLEFELGETHHLSPNFDGVKDEFLFNTEPFQDDKLGGWKMVFLDGRSRVQKTIRNRLVEEEEEIILPEFIVWNLVNNAGVTVPDGKYAYHFFTIDKNGRENLRSKGVIVVDTVPPQIDVEAPELMFSPNGDGVKDTVVIQVDAEREIKWTCTITTPEEIVVKTMEWDADIPEQIEWDGKGENGAVLPEGVYDIIISGQDGAGNRTARTIRGVTLDVRERQATVDIDYPIFSPNDDGLLDEITFYPILSDRNRIDTWDLIVQIEKGDTAKRFRGRRFIPKTVVWDGKPQRGKMTELFPEGLPSGYYTYFLKVIYRSGVNTYSFKRDLIIDNDPPKIELSVEPVLFSPDGDGKDDLLLIRPQITDLTAIQYWKATIFSSAGTPFKTFIGTDAPAEEISWDGISDTGILVDSGEDYYIQIEATDEGFNKGISEKAPFSIDILVIPTDRGLKIRVSNVEFGFNNAQLQGGKTFLILDKIVQIFNKYEKYSIRIEGHTDSTGDEDYNLELSKRRAEAVGVYLVDNGIDAERLEFEGYGERYPVDTNATLEGRRRNRRVEFLLIRK